MALSDYATTRADEAVDDIVVESQHGSVKYQLHGRHVQGNFL